MSVKIPFATQCIHQTDYRARYPEKQDAGCFVATIRHCIEQEFQQAFTQNQWNEMWRRCLEEGAISKEGFVNDHEWVGNIGLDIIGKWDEGYTFHYISIEDAQAHTLNVRSNAYKDMANHHAAVWQTASGMHMNYLNAAQTEVAFDPYPGLNLKQLQTIRHYYIGRTR